MIKVFVYLHVHVYVHMYMYTCDVTWSNKAASAVVKPDKITWNSY